MFVVLIIWENDYRQCEYFYDLGDRSVNQFQHLQSWGQSGKRFDVGSFPRPPGASTWCLLFIFGAQSGRQWDPGTISLCPTLSRHYGANDAASGQYWCGCRARGTCKNRRAVCMWKRERARVCLAVSSHIHFRLKMISTSWHVLIVYLLKREQNTMPQLQ